MGTGLKRHEFSLPAAWNRRGTLGTRRRMLRGNIAKNAMVMLWHHEPGAGKGIHNALVERLAILDAHKDLAFSTDYRT